ncbi:MAG: hypothetical protein ACK5O7_04430 [Holosporales bacterium]
MKTIKRVALACAVSVAAFTQVPGTAAAVSPVESILNALKQMAQKGEETVCRKGNLGAGVFSVRSFGGSLCREKTLAAFAEITCNTEKNVDDYRSSECHKKAQGHFGGNGKDHQTTLKNATEHWTTFIKGADKTLKDQACSVGKKVNNSHLQSALVKACS